MDVDAVAAMMNQAMTIQSGSTIKKCIWGICCRWVTVVTLLVVIYIRKQILHLIGVDSFVFDFLLYFKIRHFFKKNFTNRESLFHAKYTFFLDCESLFFAKWALVGHLRKLIHKILRFFNLTKFRSHKVNKIKNIFKNLTSQAIWHKNWKKLSSNLTYPMCGFNYIIPQIVQSYK